MSLFIKNIGLKSKINHLINTLYQTISKYFSNIILHKYFLRLCMFLKITVGTNYHTLLALYKPYSAECNFTGNKVTTAKLLVYSSTTCYNLTKNNE